MNKKIFIFIIFILINIFPVYCDECPQGEKYNSYWKKCESVCGNFHVWDDFKKECVEKYDLNVEEDKKSLNKDYVIKGNIINYSGKVLIERGMDIIVPSFGDYIYAGDSIIIDENSIANLLIDGKIMIIDKKTKFTIPSSENAANRTSKITLFFGNIWVKLKNFLRNKDDDFEIKIPTAGPGVRG
jgi:hypothetical protein